MNTSLAKKMGIIAFLCCGASASHANLVSNGSFDTDTSGWVLDQGGGCGVAGALPYSAWVASRAGHSGVVYLNACGGGGAGDPNIAQVAIAGLTAGTTYQLTWDFIRDTLGPQGNIPNSFLVELLGIPGSPFAYGYGDTNVWQTNSLSFVATSPIQSVRFSAEANGTDASYYLDDVSLVAVPEPASLALVALGLIGAGMARRRQLSRS